MGAARGIAGSMTPEENGVFLCRDEEAAQENTAGRQVSCQPRPCSMFVGCRFLPGRIRSAVWTAPVGVWPGRSRARPDASLRGLLQLRTRLFQLASTSFPSRPCVSSSGPEEKISSLVLAAFPLPKRKLHRPSMAIGWRLAPRS